MADVPEEIRREILSRLPVAPLLRLRCVSKAWKSLIDSHEFIKQHLHHSRKTNTKLSIILSGIGGIDLCSADFDLLNQTNRATFQELPHPLKKPLVGEIQILGSCDGLLALRYDAEDNTIIWNPSVRRFHEVPNISIKFSGSVVDVIIYGFGYDVVSNDYKIVRIVWYCELPKGTIETELIVYSLKFNSWRRVPDFPYWIKYITTNGEFVNGALHWIVTRKVKPDTPGTERFVAAFDLGTEEYRLMPLPKFASDVIYMTVVVLGGCLSLVCYVNEDHADLWVMKEYGVQESWSILLEYDICDSQMNFTKALAYSKCGRKVLLGLNDEVLMWYDLDKKSTDLPMVQMPLIHVYDMFTCLQSLVLLNNGACDFDLVANK